MHQSTLLVGQTSIKLVHCRKTKTKTNPDFISGHTHAIIILPTQISSGSRTTQLKLHNNKNVQISNPNKTPNHSETTFPKEK